MKKYWKVTWNERRRCSVCISAESQEDAVDILYAGSIDESSITVVSEEILSASAEEMEK